MSALGQKRISTCPFYIPRQTCSHILKTKLREALWSAWNDPAPLAHAAALSKLMLELGWISAVGMSAMGQEQTSVRHL
jgi:hypothetical protein